MKSFFSILISILLIISFSFSMSACSFYRFETGYSYFGEIPSMFIGAKTNKLKYYTDYVQFDVAYGWDPDFLFQSSQENYENYSVLIVAYDWTMIGNVPYREPTEDYESFFSTDGLFVLKEIPKENFFDSKYAVTVDGHFKAKIKYNMQETLLLPEELFENLSDSRRAVYIEIVLIGYSETDNTYFACYSNEIRLEFDKIGENKIKLVK